MDYHSLTRMLNSLYQLLLLSFWDNGELRPIAKVNKSPPIFLHSWLALYHVLPSSQNVRGHMRSAV